MIFLLDFIYTIKIFIIIMFGLPLIAFASIIVFHIFLFASMLILFTIIKYLRKATQLIITVILDLVKLLIPQISIIAIDIMPGNIMIPIIMGVVPITSSVIIPINNTLLI
jgi:hypothetical protein